jgi:hypothetical protein
MAAIAVREVTAAGYRPTTNVTSSVAEASDTFVNDGKTYLIAHNTGGGTQNFSIISTITKDGLVVANRSISMLAGTKRIIGPFDRAVYSGTVTVTWATGADDINFVPVRFV